MFEIGVPAIIAILTVATVTFAVVWRQLPAAGRQPLAVYTGSYLVTYLLGGLWIGLTDGEALVSYFRDRLYVPTVATIGVPFWVLLFAPMVIPLCVAPLFFRTPARRSNLVAQPQPDVEPSAQPGLWQFSLLFAGLCCYAVYGVFGSGRAVFEMLASIGTLNGDTTTIIERRLALFDSGTTATLGIIYSALPALCHVALFKARRPAWPWRAAAGLTIVVTLALSFATYQTGPAAVLIAALFISVCHLNLLRITWIKGAMFGVAYLMLTQLLNGWKFAEWTVGENLQHLFLRMPAAYPYFLDCFPGTVAFLGTDWFGSLTGHGLDPASPFVVARYMYPNAVAGAAMAAPAHVQAFAEGGLLNALCAVGAIALIVVAVGKLYQRSREGAVIHAVYVQCLVALYYLTQTSFRGVIWHSQGLYWSGLALAALVAMSYRPVTLAHLADSHAPAVASAKPVGVAPAARPWASTAHVLGARHNFMKAAPLDEEGKEMAGLDITAKLAPRLNSPSRKIPAWQTFADNSRSSREATR